MSAFPTRKGYRATAVDYRDGKPRVTCWEKIGDDTAQDDHIADPGKKVRRGVVAAERQPQRDLFSGD